MKLTRLSAIKDCTTYSAGPIDRNDCCVRSLSVAARLPYAEAFALFSKAGRVAGKRTPGHVSAAVYERALAFARVDTFRLYHNSRRACYPTLAQFLAGHKRGRFILHTHDHAFSVVEGVVHDWRWSGTGMRSRIIEAWRVE